MANEFCVEEVLSRNMPDGAGLKGKIYELGVSLYKSSEVETILKCEFLPDIIQLPLNILDTRLADLSPEDIKIIIQKMIKEHLGWLVVWGGFFGGFLGLTLSPIGFNIF